MIVKTNRFGEIEIREEDVIFMPEGLVGFANKKRYILLEDDEQAPFMWYQSIEEPNLCFVVVDPILFIPNYKVEVHPTDVALLELPSPADARVLVILVVPNNPLDMTANLKGPLVINPKNRLAKQVVLIDDKYPTKYFILRNQGADFVESNKNNTTNGAG